MRRCFLVALAILPACTPEAAHLAASATDLPAAAAPAVAEAVRFQVRGEAGEILYGGDDLRRLSFSARGDAGGAAGGRIELAFRPGAGTGGARGAARLVRFEVTCLEVVGSRAWIGGRLAGPEAPSDAAGDVWYVEDGGTGGVDRAGVWIGLAPDACRTRPAITWALPVTSGDLVVAAE